MAHLSKSDLAASGSRPLTKRKWVTFSAQQLLDEHMARVAAAGGVGVNEAATKAAIEHIQDTDIAGYLVQAADVDFGQVLTSGRVDRIFCLFESDLLGLAVGTGGAKPLLSTDANGFATVICDVNASRVGGILISEDNLTLAVHPDAEFAIVSNQNNLDGLAMQTVYGNIISTSGIGYAPAILGRTATVTNGVAQPSTYDPNAAPAAALRILPSGARGSVDAVGTAIAMKISTGEVSLYNNGNRIDHEVSSTGALYDYTGLSRKLHIGSGPDASANVSSNRKGEWRRNYILNWADPGVVAELTAQFTADKTP